MRRVHNNIYVFISFYTYREWQSLHIYMMKCYKFLRLLFVELQPTKIIEDKIVIFH